MARMQKPGKGPSVPASPACRGLLLVPRTPPWLVFQSGLCWAHWEMELGERRMSILDAQALSQGPPRDQPVKADRADGAKLKPAPPLSGETEARERQQQRKPHGGGTTNQGCDHEGRRCRACMHRFSNAPAVGSRDQQSPQQRQLSLRRDESCDPRTQLGQRQPQSDALLVLKQRGYKSRVNRK